jgi:hypothetical protein
VEKQLCNSRMKQLVMTGKLDANGSTQGKCYLSSSAVVQNEIELPTGLESAMKAIDKRM